MLKNINDFCLGIVLISILSVITAFATIDSSSSNYNKYIASFETVDGINKNTFVYMNGVEIGKVYSIDLVDGFANISMEINNSIKIPTDSTIVIETNDLFSSKSLSILPGFEEQYMKNKDSFITAQSSVDVLGLLNSYLDLKVQEKKRINNKNE